MDIMQYFPAQVVLHMRDKNDLVVCLNSPAGEDRVGELAAVLATVKGSASSSSSFTVACKGPK